MKLLKFGASWCQPCSILSKAMEQYQHEELIKNAHSIDIDTNPDLVSKYRIRGVPTLILLDDQENVIKMQSGLGTNANSVNALLDSFIEASKI